MASDSRHNMRPNITGSGDDQFARKPLQITLRTLLLLLTLVVALFCSAAVTFEGVALFLAIAGIAWTIIGAGYWKMRVTGIGAFSHVCGPVLVAIIMAAVSAGRHSAWEGPWGVWQASLGIGFAVGTVVSVGIVCSDRLRQAMSAASLVTSMFTSLEIRPRLQFSLRSLFILTGVVACFFSVACSVGYEEASGTLIALILIAGAARWRRSGRLLVARVVVVLLGAGLLWMVAVDRSWVREVCPHCELSRDILQYRVFRIPVHEEVLREYPTHTFRIATDLGTPCSHDFQRLLMTRYWGLFFPAHPCFRGIVRLTGDEWYDDRMAEIVRARGRESPGLAEEFHRRALVEHDDKYLYTFFVDLKRRKASGNTPQPQGALPGTPPESSPRGRGS